MSPALVDILKNDKTTDSKIYIELVKIYQDLEKEIGKINPECKMCGTCCNFGKYKHVLYASSIETDFLEKFVDVHAFNVTDNVCPFLKDNKCSIRNFRTLGCRIFYCDSKHKDTSYGLYERYLRKIKKLSNKYNIEWKYRPFLHQLAKFK
ncbi:MAG TPA: YkgJ family cysteine cluster protein [Candidatus Wujingus californicus]|uniref:YkgJ family cysteine cluster protein n=1 Tax=Candidatus Wujingus californicus TaxID=3367618 RepID=UPI001E108975|nr:YkgJ family cysteine cluster protein [Planctomycetota bacterium]MDO8130693.1 YkgJ family cysteine cluster protein [Candidatus Brocadiales bacterium]